MTRIEIAAEVRKAAEYALDKWDNKEDPAWPNIGMAMEMLRDTLKQVPDGEFEGQECRILCDRPYPRLWIDDSHFLLGFDAANKLAEGLCIADALGLVVTNRAEFETKGATHD